MLAGMPKHSLIPRSSLHGNLPQHLRAPRSTLRRNLQLHLRAPLPRPQNAKAGTKTSAKQERKAKEHANLKDAQEEEMFEWLEANPVIYSRGMAGSKDVQARNKVANKCVRMA